MQKNKTYRSGYTTGTCAAAASAAATRMLVNQLPVNEICLRLPAQVDAYLKIEGQNFNSSTATCFVIKDAGDDPDVTNGIDIHAQASWNKTNELIVETAAGIGRVTKRGLQVAVGQAAINPVPMRQIREAVRKELAEQSAPQGITITLSVPKGEEVAKRTLNSKLGVLGGISILGTTGIVKPMSEEAFKNSLAVELSVLQANLPQQAVFVLGNYGKRFVEANYPSISDRLIVISNFVGFMLQTAVDKGFKQILLIGNLGKLVKVGGGIFHTHSKVADARNEILAAHYFRYSKNAAAFEHIMQSNTTDDALTHMDDFSFFNTFCNTIKQRCEEHVKQQLKVECMVFSLDKGLLGKSTNAETWTSNFATETQADED